MELAEVTSIQIDRNDGLSSSTAIKGPVKAATTANITLSGEQTIDGVAVVTDDRVLVKDQTKAVDNGIWKVSTGVWSRAKDFSSNRDVRCGTVVNVVGGTVGSGQWQLTTSDPITIGSTSLTFQRLVLSASQLIDEDDMASNSATKVPSQQSVKAYVDSSSLVNARVYGASPSNTAAQNDAAFDAIDAIGSATLGPIFLAAGTYQTNKTPYQLLNTVFAGPGKVEMSGYAQAPRRSMMSTYPGTPDDDHLKTFDGLTEKTLTQMYSFVGSAVGSASTGLDTYQTLTGAAQEFKIFEFTGGHNPRTGDNRDRSGAARAFHRLYHGGMGDIIDTQFHITMYGTLPGQTHFLAGPAAAAFNGGVDTTAAGAYLQFYEMGFNDNGYEAAAVPRVINLYRTNAGTTFGSVWIGDRVQSGGTQAIDAFYAPSGAAKRGFDVTAATFDANKAAFALKQDDRIYLNSSSAADTTGAKWYATTVGTEYITFSSANSAIELMVGGVQAAQFKKSTTPVNWVSFTSADTATSPLVQAAGGDTNVGLRLAAKGTGSISLLTGSLEQVRVVNVASAVNYLDLRGAATAAAPILRAEGSDTNIGLTLQSKGTGAVLLNPNGLPALSVSASSTAVNYMTLAASATGLAPTFLAAGSDSDVGISILAKGNGTILFATGASAANIQFQIGTVATPVNRFRADGSATGVTPVLVTAGSDTNITGVVRGKGTGGVQLQDGGAATKIACNTTGIGFFATAPVAKQTVGAALSTGGAETNTNLATRINEIRAALIAYGLAA